MGQYKKVYTSNYNLMTRFAIQLAIVILVATSISGKIKVISPEALRNLYSDITYSLARFGDIDYVGSTLYKTVMASDEKGCNFVDHVGSNNKKVAMLMRRGDCTFSKKAANGFSVTFF